MWQHLVANGTSAFWTACIFQGGGSANALYFLTQKKRCYNSLSYLTHFFQIIYVLLIYSNILSWNVIEKNTSGHVEARTCAAGLSQQIHIWMNGQNAFCLAFEGKQIYVYIYNHIYVQCFFYKNLGKTLQKVTQEEIHNSLVIKNYSWSGKNMIYPLKYHLGWFLFIHIHCNFITHWIAFYNIVTKLNRRYYKIVFI